MNTGFINVVEQSWRKLATGNSMYVLHSKLKRLKTELREFNKTQFGNISKKVVDKRNELTDMQVTVLNSPLDAYLIEKEKPLSQELAELLQAEEGYFKQKSRVDWIKEGDQNTKFFLENSCYGAE